MQRFLIVTGILIILTGLAYPWLAKIGFGSLPGDFSYRTDRLVVHVPIVSCLVLSVLISGIFWVIRRISG
jgi:hypothetical protein